MCQLVRTLPASHPVLVHRLASLLHASFRPYLAARPLRFAITSPPSGCEEDLHLPAVEHARHTQRKGHSIFRMALFIYGYELIYESLQVRINPGKRRALLSKPGNTVAKSFTPICRVSVSPNT
jgi:hypothetical protein